MVENERRTSLTAMREAATVVRVPAKSRGGREHIGNRHVAKARAQVYARPAEELFSRRPTLPMSSCSMCESQNVIEQLRVDHSTLALFIIPAPLVPGQMKLDVYCVAQWA